MVAHPRVLPVVRANLLGPRAAANLGLPPSRDLVLLLLELKLEQLGAEDLHGADAVLQLGSLLRAEYADAGGFVHEVDGRLHLVNVLATRAAGPRGADIDILFVDLHLHLVNLRHHGDSRRGRLHATLRFRRGHALHPVHASLPLELRVHAVARHLDDDLLVPAKVRGVGGQDRRRPPLALRVPLVHPPEVPGPDARLVAAGARADLEHYVLIVQRVLGQERDGHLLLELLHLLLERRDLLPGHRLHLGIARSVLDHLPRLRLLVLALLIPGVLVHHGGELAHRLRQLLVFLGVRRDVGIREPERQLLVRLRGGLQLFDEEIGRRHGDGAGPHARAGMNRGGESRRPGNGSQGLVRDAHHCARAHRHVAALGFEGSVEEWQKAPRFIRVLLSLIDRLFS